MDSATARRCVRRVLIRYRRTIGPHTTRRCLATPTNTQGEDIRAAPPIRFDAVRNESSLELTGDGPSPKALLEEHQRTMERVRIVPASPSYFSAAPRYMDDFLKLSAILAKYQRLPVVPNGQAPRIVWKSMEVYKTEIAEPVRVKGYSMLVALLKRLNHIHPAVFPEEVAQTLEKFKRDVQPSINVPNPIPVNKWGVARAVGRRKSSHAQVYLVEGDGQSKVNGRNLAEYFTRSHDRESALWALKATQRLDKYNVWVIVRGGGTTGQAEAVTLGVAKALMAHEPALKPALRRAGVVSRDARRVERKKPGHVKARKMPTWVKR